MVRPLWHIAIYVRVIHGTSEESRGPACEDRMEATNPDGESAQAEGAKANAE